MLISSPPPPAVVQVGEVSEREVVARVTWLVGVVSAGNIRLSLGYCCTGKGVFKIIPTGRRAGWLYNLFPFIVDELLKVKGECEFARSCLVLSCPLNKATYESIAQEYKELGARSAEDAKMLVERAARLFEEIVRAHPEIKGKLCQGYNLVFHRAPIRIRKRH